MSTIKSRLTSVIDRLARLEDKLSTQLPRRQKQIEREAREIRMLLEKIQGPTLKEQFLALFNRKPNEFYVKALSEAKLSLSLICREGFYRPNARTDFGDVKTLVSDRTIKSIAKANSEAANSLDQGFKQYYNKDLPYKYRPLRFPWLKNYLRE